MHSNKSETRTPLYWIKLVDSLADVKARVAALQAEEAVLKETLIAQGEQVLEGTLHRAAVSLCEGRTTTDWQAIAKRFEPSRKLIAAHTTQAEQYYMVRLSARKTS